MLGASALLALLLVSAAQAQTTEASPLRDDDPADGGGTVELGNVWISADTGTEFEISMRVPFWADSPHQYPAAETPYMVEFDVDATGVRYGAGAIEYNGAGFYGAGIGRWEFELYVMTDDGFDWCRIGEITGNADIGDNLLTYQVPYALLDITDPADAPYINSPFADGGPFPLYAGGCPDHAYGTPAGPCEKVTSFLGRYWPQVGPSELYLDREPALGDETDGPIDTDYELGSLASLCGGGGGGGGGGDCHPDPGFNVNATMGASQQAWLGGEGYDSFAYVGPVDEQIAILGCVEEVEPATCFWEAGDEYFFNRLYQYVDPLPADAGPEIGDPTSCGTWVSYKYPGMYEMRLHGVDGEGSYDVSTVWVEVLAGPDYDGPMGDQRTDEDIGDPPHGRVEDIPSSDEPGAVIRNDRDFDGTVDSDENGDCAYVPHDASDLDADGVPDACDPDIDGDGVFNGSDNCVLTENADQADTDEDGRGDACSKDSDKDGFSDGVDNCPDDANPSQVDTDHDGRGNTCDLDVDGDTVPNKDDVFPLDPNEWADLDRDGIGDNADLDRDGDSFANSEESAAGTDPNDPLDFPSKAQVASLREGEVASAGGISIPGTLAVALGVVLVAIVLAVLLRPKRS